MPSRPPAGTDKALRLWEVGAERMRHAMTGHTEKVVACCFCAVDPQRAYSCAHDRSIKVGWV